MQALILAGGLGTRLLPLTASVPKPVLPLANRPHIAYVIDWLERHDVDDVVISCGHLADGVREVLAPHSGAAIEDAAAGEETSQGVRIRFAEEPEPRGTAGAIRFAEDFLEDRFLVINGDVLCDLDLTALIEHHERSDARATIALFPVDDVTGYGLVRRTEDGEVLEFLEKPDPSEVDTDEINAGAYVLERSVFELIPPGEEVSIERQVFPGLVGEGLFGLRLEGYWIDIGTPDRFRQANWDILDGTVRSGVGERMGGDRVLAAPDAQAGEATVRGPAMLGAGATAGRGAEIGPRAVIGSGCSIAEGAVVSDSVLLSGCTVGAGARVEGAILSAGAVVAPEASVEEGAVVGEGELVGASA